MTDPVSALTSRLIQAEERIDLLTEDVRQLRESLALRIFLSWSGLILSPCESIVVDALSDGAIWTFDRLLDRLDSIRPLNNPHDNNGLRVIIFRIRKKFRSVTPPMLIGMVHSVGYRLSPESVPLLAARRLA